MPRTIGSHLRKKKYTYLPPGHFRSSYFAPLFQNESWCKTFHMKMKFLHRGNFKTTAFSGDRVSDRRVFDFGKTKSVFEKLLFCDGLM